MMIKKMSSILLILVALLLSACTATNQIQGAIGLKDKSKVKKPDITGGILPGAAQNTVNVEGYKVSSSVGAWVSDVQYTNIEGYKVYQTVEGHIVSDQ